LGVLLPDRMPDRMPDRQSDGLADRSHRSLPDLSKVRKVLVLRFRRIGDVIMTTPALEILRTALPDAQIHYVIDSGLASLIDENPDIDRLIMYDREFAKKRSPFGRILYEWRFLKRLRREGYDLAIDFHSGPRSALSAFVTGAPTRAGFDYWPRSLLYTHSRPVPTGFSTHSVLNYLGLLERIGIRSSTRPVLKMVSNSALPRAKAIVEESKLEVGNFALVHLAGSGQFKTWPRKNFLEFARLFLSRDGRRKIALVGGKGDEGMAEILDPAASLAESGLRAADFSAADLAALAPRIVDLVGALDLKELREVASKALVYVGVDSGPMHIAATTQTPIVAIFGPTTPDTFGPWSVKAECVINDLSCRPCRQKKCDRRGECMTGVSGAMVAEAVEKIAGAAKVGLSR
jgi:lipopolysaccharide heptosyltransferase II